MVDVFISYAREDRAHVERLAELLAARNKVVWWDRDLKPGGSFRREIEQKIREAEHVLVLWSKTSVTSDFVLDEAGEALELGTLIPVRVDDCRLPMGFRQTHTHDVFEWPEDLAPVVKALCGEVGDAEREHLERDRLQLRSPDAHTAIAAATRIIESCRHPRAVVVDAYLGRSTHYWDLGEYLKAISDAEKIIRFDPRHIDARIVKGISLIRLNRAIDAVDCFSDLIKMQPDNKFAYEKRALAHSMLGRHDNALADLQQLIIIDPNDIAAVVSRSLIYEQLGTVEKARSGYRTALGMPARTESDRHQHDLARKMLNGA